MLDKSYAVFTLPLQPWLLGIFAVGLLLLIVVSSRLWSYARATRHSSGRAKCGARFNSSVRRHGMASTAEYPAACGWDPIPSNKRARS